MTARSSRDCVCAPWYCDSHRITIGRKNPNRADTAGGSTPEMKVNEPGDASDHSCRNGTKDVKDAKLAKMEMMKSGSVLKKQTANRKDHPMVFLRASAAEDWLRFSQIWRGEW